MYGVRFFNKLLTEYAVPGPKLGWHPRPGVASTTCSPDRKACRGIHCCTFCVSLGKREALNSVFQVMEGLQCTEPGWELGDKGICIDRLILDSISCVSWVMATALTARSLVELQPVYRPAQFHHSLYKVSNNLNPSHSGLNIGKCVVKPADPRCP